MSTNSNYVVFFFLLFFFIAYEKEKKNTEKFRYYQIQARTTIKISKICGTRMCMRFSQLAPGAPFLKV